MVDIEVLREAARKFEQRGQWAQAIEKRHAILRFGSDHETHVQLAWAYGNTGDFDNAERWGRAACESDEHDPWGYYYLGLALREKGRAQKDKSYLGEALMNLETAQGLQSDVLQGQSRPGPRTAKQIAFERQFSSTIDRQLKKLRRQLR